MASVAKECSVDWCERISHTKGMCQPHYARARNGRDMDRPISSPNPGEWGAWMKNKQGYICRYRKINSKSQKQLQHRYAMERHLGRELLPGENVHHINGIRDDNRLENLEIWSTSQPAGQRVADKVAWAKEILTAYEPDALA